MQDAGRGSGRDLGGFPSARLYGDQAADDAIRGGQGALLADPPRCRSQSQRGTRSLARCLIADSAPSAGLTGAGLAALVGRAFPVAQGQTGPMGGDL